MPKKHWRLRPSLVRRWRPPVGAAQLALLLLPLAASPGEPPYLAVIGALPLHMLAAEPPPLPPPRPIPVVTPAPVVAPPVVHSVAEPLPPPKPEPNAPVPPPVPDQAGPSLPAGAVARPVVPADFLPYFQVPAQVPAPRRDS